MIDNVKRKPSSTEPVKYYWDVYELLHGNTYNWNKFSYDITQIYEYKKYSKIQQDPTYTYFWKKYGSVRVNAATYLLESPLGTSFTPYTPNTMPPVKQVYQHLFMPSQEFENVTVEDFVIEDYTHTSAGQGGGQLSAQFKDQNGNIGTAHEYFGSSNTHDSIFVSNRNAYTSRAEFIPYITMNVNANQGTGNGDYILGKNLNQYNNNPFYGVSGELYKDVFVNDYGSTTYREQNQYGQWNTKVKHFGIYNLNMANKLNDNKEIVSIGNYKKSIIQAEYDEDNSCWVYQFVDQLGFQTATTPILFSEANSEIGYNGTNTKPTKYLYLFIPGISSIHITENTEKNYDLEFMNVIRFRPILIYDTRNTSVNALNSMGIIDSNDYILANNPTVYPPTGYYGTTNIYDSSYPDQQLDVSTNEYGEYEKTYYMGEVTNSNRNAYPDNGQHTDTYYYEYDRYDMVQGPARQGSYIENVVTTIQNLYPNDGEYGDYWYVYYRTYSDESIGSVLETVHSTDSNAYPNNGDYNGYHYVYTGQTQNTNYKGKYLETVSSYNNNTYPDGTYANGYWYEKWDNSDGCVPGWNDRNINQQVNYVMNINPANDYVIGGVAVSSIEFRSITKTPYVEDGKYYYYYTNTNERLVGVYNVKSCKRTNDNDYQITAYDNMVLFDKIVDEWIYNRQFPLSLTNFYHQLCDYVGIEYVDEPITNGDFQVYDNFEAINITGTQILQYIAEAAGGFAKATPDGKVCIRNYNQRTTYNFGGDKYQRYIVEEFSVPVINKLQIQMTTDDIGTIVETGDTPNTIYHITNNPLFYAESATDNVEAAENILSLIHSVEYKPGEVKFLQDYGIECGDIITVDNNTFYVMEKQFDSTGVNIRCFGNLERENNDSLNTDIIALRGKTNELIRTIDETRSTITDTAAGLRSEIIQTAENISAIVENKEQGLRSEIQQTANSISTIVADEVAEQTSSIVQTANSISSTVQAQGQTITQIRQDLNGISLSYNSQNGTASITIGDVTVSNLVDGNYVQQVVAGININGYVTFSNLATSGQTVINGDNITTGTIDAARINMTGAISWGDLDYACQGTIVSLAGQDGQDGVSPTLPAYIQATYIDSTNIYSPNIYGAHIYAGTSTSGYMSMSSTGMNFVSASGTPLVGIGYYSGNYLYPYIVLGQGVDGNNTDQGMVKKYSNGIWIGDSDGISSSSVGQGTGLFVDFNQGKIFKYVNGTATELGGAS